MKRSGLSCYNAAWRQIKGPLVKRVMKNNDMQEGSFSFSEKERKRRDREENFNNPG